MHQLSSRALKRHGQSVALTTYEQAGGGSYGAEWQPDADSPRVVKAVVDFGSPSRATGLFGTEVDADIMAIIDDEVPNLRGGGDSGATEVRLHDVAYRTLRVADYGGGFAALACERKTSGGA